MQGPFLTPLEVRQPTFHFDRSTPFQWNWANPRFGIAMNSTSFITPGFERFIVVAVRQAIARITDEDLRTEAKVFLRQEAIHARAHRMHAAALVDQFPKLARVISTVDASYAHLLDSRPLRFHLAYAANIEATFSPIYDLYLRHREHLFDDGDPRVASLFLWHFVEEIEHRSSALRIYDAVVSSPAYRLAVLPQVFGHMHRLRRYVLNAFMAEVPTADRGVGSADLRSWRNIIGLTGRSSNARGALASIPSRERLGLLYRLARTQLPGHRPESDRTPPFSEAWLAAYAAGEDVANWYGIDGSSRRLP